MPPAQQPLELLYKEQLATQYGISFNRLLTVTNMPINRFGSTLISKGCFNDYMALLKSAYLPKNLESVMCRKLISIDWQGYLYDCDFNQMLELPVMVLGNDKVHLRQLSNVNLNGHEIRTAGHCYGCTARQGSSCGGALE